MIPITEITAVLAGAMSAANLNVFSDIMAAFFSVRQHITTRSLSRHTASGLRTLSRFFGQDHDWLLIRVLIFKNFVFSEKKAYIAAVDETVVAKAGKSSFGLGSFYSSSAQKSIKSVCFFALSLIDTETGTSYMIHARQVVRSKQDAARAAAAKKKAAEGRERAAAGAALPKGRKKGAAAGKPAEPPTAGLRAFAALWREAMKTLPEKVKGIKISHMVADSAYGSAAYRDLCAAAGCFMVSRLKSNASLWESPPAPSGKRGRPAVYGKKIALSGPGAARLKKTCAENGAKTEYYQFAAAGKAFKGVPLNVVAVIKTLPNGKKSTNVFFSDDMSLSWETILAYYSMRFQIEFDFRDAKQHFGLDSFKNYKEKQLGSFVGLCFTAALAARVLQSSSGMGVADLKTLFNARYHIKNLIKLMPESLQNDFNSTWIDQYLPGDLIHAA